jgi:L-malate glycosyltransferase
MSPSARHSKRVTIVQRILPHYRVAFFDGLYSRLQEKGVQLRVVYGQHAPGTVPQSVSPERPWATFAWNRYLAVAGRSLVWQSVLGETRGANMVIVEHAARLLGTFPLLLRRQMGIQRLAYWGHGANMQAIDRDSATERFKRYLINKPDWWFAYTSGSKKAVQQAGYPEDRITIVQNAIDETELKQGLQDVTTAKIEEEKRRLGLTGNRVALYCGGMYPDKRIDFLLSACLRIREQTPDFEMLFVGSGPDQRLVEEACARHKWMHFVGPVFGAKRVLYFAMSRAFLMPGLVGLALVDSFMTGVPLFTTSIPTHSPEIDYLEHGENGLITEHSVDQYAAAVSRYLDDQAALETLRMGCAKSAETYTLGNMVNNFSQGVEACLDAPRR